MEEKKKKKEENGGRRDGNIKSPRGGFHESAHFVSFS
jgi:hypothetical protein